MKDRTAQIQRPLAILLVAAILAGLLGLSLALPAYADDDDDEGFNATLFESGFGELPSGALTVGTAVVVERGSVVAATAPVEVATAPDMDGKTLVVTGAGAAQLRFSSYPGPLPQALNSQRYELVIEAKLVAPVVDARGASLYLATVGGQRYELISFGADGNLSRAGQSLGLAYTANRSIEIEARVDLKAGQMILKVKTPNGELVRDGFNVPGAFDPDTVGQLIFAAGGATGRYAIDKVKVKVEKDDDDDDDDPPARIVITPPPPGAVTFEVYGDVTLVVFNITIKNNGGRAKDVFLTLECDDDLLELLDLSWVAGIGYVKEIKDGKIVIGIGEYNAIRKDTYDLKFKFKLKVKRDGELKLNIKYSISYRDSGGAKVVAPIIIVIVVPPIGAPLATPTASPTVTGTPPTATPTASPTVTGTPPTATPTLTGTPPTATPSATSPPPTATPTATP